MKRYRTLFHPRARQDLIDLQEYIEDSGGPARAFISAISDYCLKLATFPNRGIERNDLGEGVRVVGFRRRVSIAFLVEADAVWILGIYYGGRSVELSSLEEDDKPSS